jgi:hypothetical protein
MRTIKLLIVGVLATSLIAGGIAGAANFSPKTSFKLSPAKIKKAAKLTINVAQDKGEEELLDVTLKVPAGFSLPSDKAIRGCSAASRPDERFPCNGDVLGTGAIDIMVGPSCANNDSTLASNRHLSARLVERNRTDDERDEGIYAVWILDIQGVTTIPLQITGSKRKGWKLYGEIAPNQLTCTPFKFGLTIPTKSADGKGIIKNPSKAGRYTFSATFGSATSPARRTIKQTIRIKR